MRGRLDGLVCLALFVFGVISIVAARAEERSVPVPLSKTVEKPAEESEKEASLRAFLFQTLVDQDRDTKVFFVDYASRRNYYNTMNVKLVDPPIALLKTLSTGGKDIRPVSKVMIVPSTGWVTASESGKGDSVILSAWVVRWVDADTAEVEYMEHQGFLAASGAGGVARFKDGKWSFELKSSWDS